MTPCLPGIPWAGLSHQEALVLKQFPARCFNCRVLAPQMHLPGDVAGCTVVGCRRRRGLQYFQQYHRQAILDCRLVDDKEGSPINHQARICLNFTLCLCGVVISHVAVVSGKTR